MEDAHTVCAVCDECAGEREKGGEGGGVEGADKQATRLQAWCDILEVTKNQLLWSMAFHLFSVFSRLVSS